MYNRVQIELQQDVIIRPDDFDWYVDHDYPAANTREGAHASTESGALGASQQAGRFQCPRHLVEVTYGALESQHVSVLPRVQLALVRRTDPVRAMFREIA